MPTSATNWMAYFANHGAPAVPPGPGWWQSGAMYDQATTPIASMGSLMGTDPYDGTYSDKAISGMSLWLAAAGAPCFVIHSGSTAFWSPTFQAASDAVFAGGYVMVGVGWYELVGGIVRQRVGGHYLTLSYGARTGSSMTIGWRDPGSDEGDLFAQSLFATEKYPIVPELVHPTYGVIPRIMSKPVGYGNGYIDGTIAILPLFALTTGPDSYFIKVYTLTPLFDAFVPKFLEFSPPEDTAVTALALHPDTLSVLFLADDDEPGLPARLWRTDRITGETTEIDLDLDLDDPRDLVVGRRRDLYLIDGDDLVLCRIDTEKPQEIVHVTPPHPCHTLAFDDAADKIVLLSTTDRKLLEYGYHLDGGPIVRTLPDILPLEGRTRFVWDHGRDCAWIISEASDSLHKLWENPFTGQLEAILLDHSDLDDPRAIAVDDTGRFYVSNEGEICEFELNDSGELIAVADGHFAGVPCGDFLCIPRSSSNFDPAIHTLPGWEDVPPRRTLRRPDL